MDHSLGELNELWAMLCRDTQDGWVKLESSDKTWPTGEGNGKPLQYSCLENPMNHIKRQKDMTLKDELPRSVGDQYVTGEVWRNSSKEWRGWAKAKTPSHECDWLSKWSPMQWRTICIGTWNVRSMNEGKWEVVKQETARVNVNILRISELKWTGMGKFNSDNHYIYYCGQESLRRNGVAAIVNKSPKCSTWMQSQKWQNYLCSFPRQTIQYRSYPSLGFNQ